MDLKKIHHFFKVKIKKETLREIQMNTKKCGSKEKIHTNERDPCEYD